MWCCAYKLTYIQGCGYPPRTVCSDFVSAYANETDEPFTCYVSRADPNLVIVDLDLSRTRSDLFYCLAIPVPCLVAAIVYIVVAYVYIYTDPPEVCILLFFARKTAKVLSYCKQ